MVTLGSVLNAGEEGLPFHKVRQIDFKQRIAKSHPNYFLKLPRRQGVG